MIKKTLSVRLLSGLLCSLVAGAVLCIAEPSCAASWSTSSGSGWGSSDSGSTSDSGSGASWATQKSGSTWGSFGSSSGASQQQSYSMPDPLQQISLAEYQNMVSQFRGKIVIVNFFASWCGPCRQELADLKELRQRISPDDLAIISVSIDESKSDLISVLKEINFNYPTAWASDELKRAFKIQSIPRMVIYDRQGGTWIDEVGLVPREQFFDVIQQMVNF